MSRSVASRRSLGSQSKRSSKTTLSRISSGISFTTRLTEKKSQLSLIQRSVPSTITTKTISTQEKAIKILENLAKRIPKMNLKPDQQFNFCLSLKQLHEQIDNPKQSGFWADWDSLKQSIITSVTELSIQPPDIENLIEFCNSSLDQFSISLGNIQEKLPLTAETSRKSDSIQQKFHQLIDAFSQIQKKLENLYHIYTDNSQMRSLITKLSAFRIILPTEYQLVFLSMRDTETRKGNGVVTRNPLLSPKQRSQIIRNLTTRIESIEHRLSEFIDPKLAVLNITEELQNVELNLRKVITDFPEEKRKEKSKAQTALEEKQQRFHALESRLVDLRAQHAELTNELAMLTSTSTFLKEKIIEERKSWKNEKKDLLATLNGPIDQNAIQKSARTLEKLRKQNYLLQKEISSRNCDLEIDELRNLHISTKHKYNEILHHMNKIDDDLLKQRAQNNVFIDLLDDDYLDYKNNTALFIEKRVAQIQLDSENDTDFRLKLMNDKRCQIQSSKEKKVPSQKEVDSLVAQNHALYDQIESKVSQLAKLRVRSFKRRFRNYILTSTNSEYEKVKKEYDSIVSTDDKDSPTDFSELSLLKAEAELLKGEFKLSVLRSSLNQSQMQNQAINQMNNQQLKDEENQIQQQKILNQRIIKNGNDIRSYLLRVQAKNSAINLAIKCGKNIDVINEERRKKSESAMKYEEARKEQDRATEELEQILGIQTQKDVVIETRFALILDAIRNLESLVDGDLTEKIEELRRKNRMLERKNPPNVQNEYSYSYSEGA
ncbi:hypothetical protein TRFO_04041 [Tritrichomonas foetus]|uniref:Uncharacterized protein n=1 Tax=Tritrichomonas foetus TaxID=1144522 RepID=A0A1J4KJH7_9EUKA|nr:hypothetical protein TRFO_04041 [Tritrichomonas foetus]|eukprot:OHT11096.1 hypothetical protein TRFO_04041 [Tritrichomonas foetus]